MGSLGADVAVDYHSASVFDAVPDGSVDFVFDNLGVDANLAVRKLTADGIFISIVNVPPSHHDNRVRQSFYYVWSDDQLPKIVGKLDFIAKLIDAGKFKVFVDDTYDFDQIKEAYSRLFVRGNLRSRI